MTNNEILVDLAKKNYGKFLVATGNVGSQKKTRYYTNLDKASLDNDTKSNIIGDIINTSQIINSKIWEAKKRGDLEEVEKLYQITCHLNICSCCAIDNAKRPANIDLDRELKIIKDNYVSNDLKPKFFEFISKDKGNLTRKENYRWYDCPMDYLIKIIDKESRKRLNSSDKKEITLTEIIKGNKNSPTDTNLANKKGVIILMNKAIKVKNEMEMIWTSNKNGSDKYLLNKELLEDFLKTIEKTTLRVIDIKNIVYKLEKQEEYTKIRKLLLESIYKIYPDIFTELFSK